MTTTETVDPNPADETVGAATEPGTDTEAGGAEGGDAEEEEEEEEEE